MSMQVQILPAESTSAPAPAVPSTVVFYACAQTDLDASTGVCTHPVWVAQPSIFPPLSAAQGIAIAVAILALWALAFGIKSIQGAGD